MHRLSVKDEYTCNAPDVVLFQISCLLKAYLVSVVIVLDFSKPTIVSESAIKSDMSSLTNKLEVVTRMDRPKSDQALP